MLAGTLYISTDMFDVHNFLSNFQAAVVMKNAYKC